MDVLVLIGRILFVLIALGSALAGHFGATSATAGYAESRGFKNARFWVLASGVWLLLAAVSVILGIFADLGALMFTVFALIAAFTAHHFWTDEDPMARQMEQTQFMKDLSIAGGGLIAFAYFVTLGESAAFVITGPLFNL